MARLIKKDRGNYTNISNVLVRDKRLSWKARGIFIYLWSQANEWQFYVSEIATHATDGERALRSGIKELETYGYLKRVHSHSDSGSFDGMDWVLSDHPEQNRNDAEMNEKPPKNEQNASDAKRIRCEKHSMQKVPLRNNNSKNYQHKELPNTSNKSSSSSSSSIDPFEITVKTKEEEDQKINELIKGFSDKTGYIILKPQYNQINKLLHKLSLSDATDQMSQVVDSIDLNVVRDPVAYLIQSLRNAV